VSWRWLDRCALESLHDESLADHGGASGLRDEGLLDFALARPLTLAAYGQPDVANLAAQPTASVWRATSPSQTVTSASLFWRSACFWRSTAGAWWRARPMPR
jgi:hypothetical protein